jgi:hypothetical protein
MPSSEWSVTIRDRCNVTHATQSGNPRGSTFVMDASFSGNSLNRTCNLIKADTSAVMRKILSDHFDGHDLSTAVTAEGKSCTMEIITKEVFILIV